MIIDLCANFISSTIEFCKNTQIDEKGNSPCPDSTITAAAQKLFNDLGSPPSSLLKMHFLTDMSMQLPVYLSYKLYKFYFYQFKEIADSKGFDNELAIQLDKTTQIAEKAIREYQECIKLVEKGIGRELFNFLPNWVLNRAYGHDFISLKIIIEPDSLPLPDDYADCLLSQLPKTELENFRLVTHKANYIDLPSDSWAIINSEQKRKIMLPAKVFAKIHHRAIEDISRLFHQYADNPFYQNLVDKDFETCEFFLSHQKRVEVYEQHQFE
ncbi:hypothetical protein PRO82_001722 [Candidatus Protochlamydia amoebophila]|uniref:hypothetical protein n=1 Tax=Candidatus Protochlamydia amoebophila TaxID=362787 RepID=UPI001BC8FD5C|nr:hypothetical protein [Candidatus Protochlamydia amoebophila]MBS4164394.1 hypothetical protein [Candidatus Protochlamydia amoebophila]